MLKKILAALLACTMLINVAACGKPESPQEPTTAEVLPTVEEAVASMIAPIDALTRCMIENNLTYDAADPEFIWTSLFYFVGSYASQHVAVTETEDGYLNVPADVMLEHAAALFSTLTELPELPAMMHGNITYDESTNAYRLAPGDHGLFEIKLTDARETENGYTLTAQLWNSSENHSIIAEWDTTLEKLTFTEHSTLPKYLCSVSAMQQIQESPLLSEDIPTLPPTIPQGEAVTAVFNGLSDSHTAEVTLPNGSVVALQFDANVATQIASVAEGDSFTFRYITDSSTGAMKLLSIE